MAKVISKTADNIIESEKRFIHQLEID